MILVYLSPLAEAILIDTHNIGFDRGLRIITQTILLSSLLGLARLRGHGNGHVMYVDLIICKRYPSIKKS